MITGSDLIAWGYKPGPWFKSALDLANRLESTGALPLQIVQALDDFAPAPVELIRRRERGDMGFTINLDTDTPDEDANYVAVTKHMHELMRVPTIKAGAVMPDACPAGSAPGTIPVGGIVACENAIHPGYHSADICCSMAISILDRDTDPLSVLDAAMNVTHFGPGGRDDMQSTDALLNNFMDNYFLEPTVRAAVHHFGTQGDGNHFFYVGRLKSSGEVAIVTHHGSRKPGAMLYKAGMVAAERNTKRIAAGVPKHQAWITADTEEGQEYWAALQLIREWTKQNHYAIHDAVANRIGAEIVDRFWNEHNFVWQKPDGLFYHGKGATPAFPNFSADTNGLTLIPMNMAEPILIARGLNASNGLGFAPHGAGRNVSRTQFKRTLPDDCTFAAAGLPPNLDARWFSGTPDTSEMPNAYKNAESVRRQIAKFGLAEIVDEVLPFGGIMAGEIDWRNAGKTMGEMA